MEPPTAAERFPECCRRLQGLADEASCRVTRIFHEKGWLSVNKSLLSTALRMIMNSEDESGNLPPKKMSDKEISEMTVDQFVTKALPKIKALPESETSLVQHGQNIAVAVADAVTPLPIQLVAALKKIREGKPWGLPWIMGGIQQRVYAIATAPNDRAHEMEQIQAAFQAGQVVVLHGESGAGKSSLLFLAVQAMPNDTCCVGILLRSWQSDGKAMGSDALSADAVRDFLLTTAVSQLQQLPVIDKPSKLQLVFGIDEAMSNPCALRLLCSQRLEWGKFLVKSLSDKMKDRNVTITACHFVAAGTGCNGTVTEFGSEPSSYCSIAVQPCPIFASLATHYKAELLSDDQRSNLANLFEVVKEDRIGGVATENPRFAEIVAQVIYHGISDTHESRWLDLMKGTDNATLRALMPQLLRSCAVKFKRMNGCDWWSPDQMRQYLQEALSYVLNPKHYVEKVPPTSLFQGGMLRDTATLILSGDYKAFLHDVVAWNVDKTKVLVVAKGTPRFQMSGAQVLLTLMGYGLGDLGHTWNAFEDAGAQWLSLVATGLLDASPQDFVQLLRGVSPTAALTTSTKRVPNSRVCIMRAQHQIYGDVLKKDDEVLITEQFNAVAGGVIVINAPGAPFADVIGIFPGLILLVQCKYLAHNELSPRVVANELDKMGWENGKAHNVATNFEFEQASADAPAHLKKIPNQLLDLAKVPAPGSPSRHLNPQVGFVFITTKEGALQAFKPDDEATTEKHQKKNIAVVLVDSATGQCSTFPQLPYFFPSKHAEKNLLMAASQPKLVPCFPVTPGGAGEGGTPPAHKKQRLEPTSHG